jgi:hypothetical protein
MRKIDLFNELSARLSSGLIVKYQDENYMLRGINQNGTVSISKKSDYNKFITVQVDQIKPWLFPLSSITEKQRQELQGLANDNRFSKNGYFNLDRIWVEDIYKIMNKLNEWHIDYNRLIESNNANDASTINIY